MNVAFLGGLRKITLWISTDKGWSENLIFNDDYERSGAVNIKRYDVMAALALSRRNRGRLAGCFLGNNLLCTALQILAVGMAIYISQPEIANSQPAPAGVGIPPSEASATVSFAQPLANWLTQPTMTGDWGGVRPGLRQYGINFRGSYIGEYAYNSAGGKRIGGDYAQQWSWGMDVDMDKVAGLAGGMFQFAFNQREGRSTSADYVGNRIAVQNIFGGGENLRVTALSYEQMLFGKTLDLKAGYLVLGDDFARTPVLCIFQNVGFCAHPQSLPTNSGWTDYPNSRWGGEAILNLPDQTYAEAAVFDVNPTYALHNNGLKFGLQGSTGVLFALEFGKIVELGPAALPGHYKAGGYYDTSQAPDIANSHMTYSGRYGGYILADQMVWSFQPGTDRGLIVVANATVTDKGTSPITPYFTFALIAQGPFASRPRDSIAIGYIRDIVNGNQISKEQALLTARGVQHPSLAMGENIVELAYGIQATPWMAIHPNVQYIGNPGAFSFDHVPDAWVFGVHLGLIY